MARAEGVALLLSLLLSFFFVLTNQTRQQELIRRFESQSKRNLLVRPRPNGARTGPTKVCCRTYTGLCSHYVTGLRLSQVKVSVTDLTLDLDAASFPLGHLRAVVGLSWADRRLAWDQRAFRMSQVKVEPGKLWTPDVAVFNR